MSKVADAIIEVQEAYESAMNECMFWTGQMEKYGYSINDAIVAAQHYGRMCAFAQIQRELLGDDSLWKNLEGFTPRLYKSEYESSQ